MLDENYIVEKSKSLVWAQFRDYGAGELKILETYLSRINARDPDSSLVTFTKREYADLMGIDPDVRTEQLKNYTRGLLSNVVTIDLPGKGYVQYPLFSEAKCEYDTEQGQITITIECNEKLKPAFFSLAENGYVHYELRNVIALGSQYSLRLYPRLKDRPFGWTVELDELRNLLGATADTYKEFKRFNSLVLQKAVKEINEITDINVTTENIKKGRSVVAIKFSIANKERLLQTSLFEEDMEEETGPVLPDPDDPLAFYADALPEDFTREQVDLLRDLAGKHVPYTVMSFGEKELWMYEYLQSKVALMRAQKKPVQKNAVFSWLRKAVEEDWK